ncbi:MAG: hypothetical protein EBY46_11660 [Rhodobacteraceae bacterium]|nr:hypothetical protein [Paracoccaceae bacterium]
MRGTLVLRDGKIAEIDLSGTSVTTAEDLEGAFVAAGLVELHTDNLERHLEPRPGVHWPKWAAVLAHDSEMAGCGVTTVFDAMRVGYLSTYGENTPPLPVDWPIICCPSSMMIS